MTLAEQIREAREARGWTHTQLGAAIGVGAQTVMSWEAGRRLPSTAPWLALCAVLGLDPRDFPSDPAVASGAISEPKEVGR
jgi:transcriptional regulator with XRE-family HTH domain